MKYKKKKSREIKLFSSKYNATNIYIYINKSNLIETINEKS